MNFHKIQGRPDDLQLTTRSTHRQRFVVVQNNYSTRLYRTIIQLDSSSIELNIQSRVLAKSSTSILPTPSHVRFCVCCKCGYFCAFCVRCCVCCDSGELRWRMRARETDEPLIGCKMGRLRCGDVSSLDVCGAVCVPNSADAGGKLQV